MPANAKNEIIDTILPLTEAAGGGGHEVAVHYFFSLVLPTAYYNRLLMRLDPDTYINDDEVRADLLSAITAEWNVSFDARTSSDWALFQAGGVGSSVNAQQQSCHRCPVLYCELGVVFDVCEVQESDAVNSIAEAHENFPTDLKVINPAAANAEKKLKSHHSKAQRTLAPQQYPAHCPPTEKHL
ncbi:hypothetical protein CYMTET_40418 [Cymbomonas tetramitiformis]|uniref:Uncharacterized protein n=1 Tax=Cymbomonas tetramitiformis TaxID=36881 RepID=A0AAE0CAC3_9CHLO|nr:hypothetical protein CYMTET_40418 [Cymbomonas tetramitiformis]